MLVSCALSPCYTHFGKGMNNETEGLHMVLRGAKNYVFIGESGAGKTELSVNTARLLARDPQKRVYVFDMDQTKGLFRTRDLAADLAQPNIRLVDTASYMDSPVVPAGVLAALEDQEAACVFDVGGNAVGAKMIGQYSKALGAQNTRFLYVINPFRPFSEDLEEAVGYMAYLLSAGRINPAQVAIVSNPCLGAETGLRDVVESHRRLVSGLKAQGYSPAALVVAREHVGQVEKQVDEEVVPIDLFVRKLYRI